MVSLYSFVPCGTIKLSFQLFTLQCLIGTARLFFKEFSPHHVPVRSYGNIGSRTILYVHLILQDIVGYSNAISDLCHDDLGHDDL